MDDADIELPEVMMPSLTQQKDSLTQYDSPPTMSASYPPPSLSSTTTEMKFDPSHFGDSSEDEDFVHGLAFEENSKAVGQHVLDSPITLSGGAMEDFNNLIAATITQNITQNATNVISSLGQNLLASVIGQQQVQNQKESSYSDLEKQKLMTKSASRTLPKSSSRSITEIESELDDDFEVISDDDFH